MKRAFLSLHFALVILLFGSLPAWSATNQIPTLLNSPVPNGLSVDTTRQNDFYLYTLEFYDADGSGDDLKLRILRKPAAMKIAKVGKNGCCVWRFLLMWKPLNSDVGLHQILLEAYDDFGGKVRLSYRLKVLDRNDRPQIMSNPTVKVNQGQTYLYVLKASDPDRPSQALSFVLLHGPKGMFLDAKGMIRWLPKALDVGKHSVTVAVRDSLGAEQTQSFVLEVIDVPEQPVFTSKPLVGAMVGQPYLYHLRARDPDQGSKLQYKILKSPAHVTLEQGLGLLRWLPSAIGVYSFEVEVKDSTGLSIRQKWQVKVVAKNQAPLISTSATHWVNEESTFRFLLEASDPENDPLRFVLIEAPLGLQLQTQGSQKALLIWNTKAGDAGFHKIVVRIDDQKGAVVFKRLQLWVRDINNRPEILSRPKKTALQDALYRYFVRASDKDFQELLSFSLNQAPQGMKIHPSSGKLEWKPTHRDVGHHVVEIVARDVLGKQSVQKYTLEVFDRNDAPIWKPGLFQGGKIKERKLFTQTFQARDVDKKDVLRYRLMKAPFGMSMDVVKGTLRWTPMNNQVGEHVVIVEAFDQRAGRTSHRFVLFVENVNSNPVITSTPLHGAVVGQLYLYRVLAFDPDSSQEILRFSLRKSPTGMTLDPLTGALSWRPEVALQGKSYDIALHVTDGKGGLVVQSFSLKIYKSQGTPSLKKPLQTKVKQGQAYQEALKVEDPEKDKLNFVLLKAPKGMSISSQGILTWLPNRSQVGSFRLQIRVDDGKGGVLNLHSMMEVEGQNHSPKISSLPPLEVYEGALYTYALHAEDLDVGDYKKLRWTLVKGPKGCQLNGTSGLLQWTPKEGEAGLYEVLVQVSDPQKAKGTQSFYIFVREQNQVPIIATKSLPKGKQGKPYFYQVTAKDIDFSKPQKLRYSLLKAPQGLSVSLFSGVLKWLPRNRDVRVHEVHLKVWDDDGFVATKKFRLTIEDENDRPVFLSTSPKGVTIGQTYRYLFDVRDPDNPADNLTFKLVQKPSSLGTADQMKLDPSKKEITWTPTKKSVGGVHDVSIRVVDARGGETFQRFQLRVYLQNQIPSWSVVPKGILQITQGLFFKRTLKASDADKKDALQYYLVKGPAGMILHPQTGVLVWEPNSKQVGSHDVKVIVFDQRGGEAEASFHLQVKDKNDTPRVTSRPLTWTRQGQGYRYAVQAFDPDGSSDKLRYVLLVGPKGMVIDPVKGILLWHPTSQDVGLYSVLLQVTDQAGLFCWQRFLLRVESLHIAPRIVSLPFRQAIEGKLYRYQIQVRDSKPERKLFYQILDAPKGMTIDSERGLIQWLPTNRDAHQLSHLVSIQVTDIFGGNTSQKFSLHVLNRNNAPRFLSIPCVYALADATYNCVLRAEDRDPELTRLAFVLIQKPKGMSIGASSSVQRGGSTLGTAVLVWKPRYTDVGDHLVEIAVYDGSRNDRIRFLLRVHQERNVPIADPGDDSIVLPGSKSLDGSRSRDAKSFEWSLLQQPQEALAKLLDRFSAKPQVILRRAGLYIFQLVVKNEKQQSPSAVVRVQVKNVKPHADFYAPLAMKVGDKVVLDGSLSGDPNGDSLHYLWRSTPSLPIEGKQKPVFAPKKPGIYQIELIVEEKLPPQERLRSAPKIIPVVVYDKTFFPPFAAIIAPPSATVGEEVSFDGRRSRGLHLRGNAKLSYQWELLEGKTKGRLLSARSSKTVFIAKQPGFFRVGLVVREKGVVSLRRSKGIRILGRTSREKLPIARAKSGFANFESWHVLDALESIDPSGGQLSFRWKQTSGIPVQLRDEKTARPSFFTLSRGKLRFRLWVRGSGGVEGEPVDIVVSVNGERNRPPTAKVGEDLIGNKSREVGAVISFDGSASSDPEKKRLRYRWKQTDGIPVAMNHAVTAKPSWNPLVYGIYRFGLEVFDGQVWSLSKQIQAVVHDKKNHVPHANAGVNQLVRLGEEVTLSGVKSSDLDGKDKLVYHWSLIEPNGFQVPLNVADPIHPSFTALSALVSRYVFALQVDDGKSFSVRDTVTIRVQGTNRPPVANIISVGALFAGDYVQLDGSSSFDPDGDKITFKWTQIAGVHVQLELIDKGRRVRFKTTSAESFKFRLQVDDGHARSAPAEYTLQVKGRAIKEQSGCSCDTGREGHEKFRFFAFCFSCFLLSIWLRARSHKSAL